MYSLKRTTEEPEEHNAPRQTDSKPGAVAKTHLVLEASGDDGEVCPRPRTLPPRHTVRKIPSALLSHLCASHRARSMNGDLGGTPRTRGFGAAAENTRKHSSQPPIASTKASRIAAPSSATNSGNPSLSSQCLSRSGSGLPYWTKVIPSSRFSSPSSKD